MQINKIPTLECKMCQSIRLLRVSDKNNHLSYYCESCKYAVTQDREGYVRWIQNIKNGSLWKIFNKDIVWETEKKLKRKKEFKQRVILRR